jgi:hypothetical protein
MGKEMMNTEQGISNVEGLVRILFRHHSTFRVRSSKFNGIIA